MAILSKNLRSYRRSSECRSSGVQDKSSAQPRERTSLPDSVKAMMASSIGLAGSLR
jgi:hypothetical protein